MFPFVDDNGGAATTLWSFSVGGDNCCVAIAYKCVSRTEVLLLVFVLNASDASNCSRRLVKSPASRTAMQTQTLCP
jgi:hypothetical protein